MAEFILSFADRATTIAKDSSQLVGCTPMVYLSKKINQTHATIALKMESSNPMCSVKDRLALSVITEAEKAGKLQPGGTIIEVTSGNTGIALAYMATARGYKTILIMPETMSLERRVIFQIMGAQLILTPASLGLKGAIRRRDQILKQHPEYYNAAQFDTPYNAKVHFETTGPEIWSQTQGKVDVLVAGIGTGGTVSGTGRFLKSKKASVQVYGVEPEESSVINGGKPGPHSIQGMGAGFVPSILEKDVLTETLMVKSDDALSMARTLPQADGLFVGISSGANVTAALRIAAREDMAGKLIVAIIPSFGERYLSSKLFAEIRDAAAKWPVVPVEELPDPAAAPAAAAPAAEVNK